MGFLYNKVDKYNNEYKPVNITLFILGIIVFLIAMGFGIAALSKTFNVWSKQQSGKAVLAEAEFSKQVQIEQAKANLEAEKLNAQAEVERARGAAESIKIEGGQLTDNYIKYLWVRNLQSGDKQLIYVPTEAGLPLLEAGKR